MSHLIKNAPAFLLRDARHAMHDILLLRISAILPEAISDGGIDSPTDTDLLIATYRGGSHLTSDIFILLDYYTGNMRNRPLRSTPYMPRSDEVVCILFQILYNLLEDICPVTHLHSDRPDLFFLPSSESKTSLLHQNPALLFLNEVRNF